MALFVIKSVPSKHISSNVMVSKLREFVVVGRRIMVQAEASGAVIRIVVRTVGAISEKVGVAGR